MDYVNETSHFTIFLGAARFLSIIPLLFEVVYVSKYMPQNTLHRKALWGNAQVDISSSAMI